MWYMNIFFSSSILFSGLAFHLLWKASLISYLSKRTIKLPFNSLATLLSDTNYDIGILLKSNAAHQFEFSKDPDFQRAWEERIRPNLENYASYGADESLTMIMDFQKTAFYSWIDIVVQVSFTLIYFH